MRWPALNPSATQLGLGQQAENMINALKFANPGVMLGATNNLTEAMTGDHLLREMIAVQLNWIICKKRTAV